MSLSTFQHRKMFTVIFVVIVLSCCADTLHGFVIKDKENYIRSATEELDWELVSSSVDVRTDEVVFSVQFITSTHRPVQWSVDYMPILASNTEFSIRSSTNGNTHTSELTAHMPADGLFRRLVQVHFNVTHESQQNPVPQAHLTLLFNTLMFNSSTVFTNTDSGQINIKLVVDSSKYEDSIGRTFTVIPRISDFSYNFGRTLAQYSGLRKNSDNDTIMDSVTRYFDDEDPRFSLQNLTAPDGQLKAEVKLSNYFENNAGNLLMDTYINLNGDAVSQLELMVVLKSVFTDGAVPDILRGTFGLDRPNFNQVPPTGTGGVLSCASMGVPPARLNFVKVNNDGTTSPVPFQNEKDFFEDYTSSYLQMVTKNMTREMDGKYACVGTVGSATKMRSVLVDLMFAAKFDRKLTKLTIDIDGKVTVNISATANPLPTISCYENDKDGDEVTSNQAYMVWYYSDYTDNKRTGMIIEFDSPNNGTTYGPLYRLVCSAESWAPDYKHVDWLTITV